jgi:CheY-like chemotaxis protein
MQLATTSIKSILLVDDDQDDYFLFGEALKKTGLSVSLSYSSNFLEAVAYLTTQLPDIIFLDLNMPFKNGLDALSDLQAEENFRSIPVVIFSSSTYSRDIKIAYERGAALYFTKPSSFDTLAAALEQILLKSWQKPALITAQYFIDGCYIPFQPEAV